MRINEESINRVTAHLSLSDAKNTFGTNGEDALFRVINKVRLFFQSVPPEYIDGGIMFIEEISPGSADHIFSTDNGISTKSLHDFQLPELLDSIDKEHRLVVRAHDTSSYEIKIEEGFPDASILAKSCIVFINQGGEDSFYIGDQCRDVPPMLHGISSNYAIPTISDLSEALRIYGLDANNVSCPWLATAWEGGKDGPRLAFKNKPESTMRTSLYRFLSVRLGANASVRPEHNTDESKPVDIVVNWSGSSSRALIEIKWLGKSLTNRTHSDGSPKFTEYSEARARDGYDQLADYLDREASTDPSAALRGYLVVFDGRRRNVLTENTPVSSADGEHYRNREIHYTKDHASMRQDMASPIRYFLSARKSFYQSSV